MGDSLTKSINDEAVCRTAPDTPGLLKIIVQMGPNVTSPLKVVET